MRIRTKLIASLCLSAFTCTVALVGLGWGVTAENRLITAQDRAQTAAHAAADLLVLTQEFAFRGEPRAAQQWWKRHAAITQAVAVTTTQSTADSKSLLVLRASFAQLAPLFSALEQGAGQGDADLLVKRRQMVADTLLTRTQGVSDDTYLWAGELSEERKTVTRYLVNFFIAMSAAFILVILQLEYLVFGRVLRALRPLERAVAAVREGDFTTRTDSLARDELGELGRAFDAMNAALLSRDARIVETTQALEDEIMRRAAAEARVRLITDNLPILVAYVTREGRYGFANRQYDFMLGLDSARMVGRLVRDVLGETMYKRIQPHADLALQGTTAVFEMRIESEYAQREVQTSFIPDFDPLGTVQGYFVMHEDVTAQKEAESRMQVLNDRYALATRSGGIGIWEWNILSNELAWDEQIQLLYRFSAENHPSVAFNLWRSRLHADDVARVMAELAAAVKGEQAYDTEYRIILPDGDMRVVKASGIVTPDAAGKPLSMIGMNWDITPLRRAQEQQRFSDERFRLLIDGVADYAIVMLDASGVVQNWNAAAQLMKGYGQDEIIGQHFSIFYTASDIMRKHPAHLLDNAASTGRAFDLGWRVRKDGSLFWAEVTLTALRDSAGALLGFGKVIRDLSEQKQREEAIEQALQEKETLLKEVYHRVKNNLQVVTSLLNLQARTLGPGQGFDALNESVTRVKAMSLVHEKLYQSSNLSSIALADYIRELCQNLAMMSAIQTRGIALECELETMDIGLETAVPLGLLLNELVSNCFKHAFRGRAHGTVKVGLRMVSPGQAMITVSDDGVGMDPEINLETCKSLGLKLAKTLSAQLDGTLAFKAGDGTTVSLLFPLNCLTRSRPEIEQHAHV